MLKRERICYICKKEIRFTPSETEGWSKDKQGFYHLKCKHKEFKEEEDEDEQET